jgi:glyoxylase-like metal-dependent hydrolase (beta-lactamase superfamily II)
VFANWLNRAMFRFQISREQEIDKQLLKLNIKPKDVKAVFLTHLHLDHIDGLKHFPETKIVVNKLVFLPSHDREAGKRLKELVTLKII